MNLETQLQEGERSLARIWKATALRGALAIAFAVVILIWPSIGLSALIALFGAFALVSGVGTIAGAFSIPMERSPRLARRRRSARSRGRCRRLRLARPVGAGTALCHRRLGDRPRRVRVRPRLRAAAQRRRALLLGLGGLLSIAFGVIMFAHPGAGAVALLALDRGVRARDRRHADRLCARAAARRRRARAARPAARHREGRDARLTPRRSGVQRPARRIGVAPASTSIVRRRS